MPSCTGGNQLVLVYAWCVSWFLPINLDVNEHKNSHLGHKYSFFPTFYKSEKIIFANTGRSSEREIREKRRAPNWSRSWAKHHGSTNQNWENTAVFLLNPFTKVPKWQKSLLSEQESGTKFCTGRVLDYICQTILIKRCISSTKCRYLMNCKWLIWICFSGL